MEHDIKDVKLAKGGKLRIEWAKQSMPVLERIKARFSKQKPLRGVRVGACLHVTTETAALMQTLKAEFAGDLHALKLKTSTPDE